MLRFPQQKLFSFNFLVIFIILIFLLISIWVLQFKEFDPDEYESLHTAWCINEGQVIYSDFADAHGPAFAYFNASVWKVFSLKSSISTLFLFRYLSYIWMLIILFITYKTGLLLFNKQVGLIAVLLLVSNYVFLIKAIEVRPDLLQNVFWFSGFYLLLLKFKRNLNYSFLIGICWFISLIANLKAILAIGLALLFLLFFEENKNENKFIFIFIFKIIYMIASLFIVYFVYLYFSGGAAGYVESVLFAKAATTKLIQIRENINFFFMQFMKSGLFFVGFFLLGIIKVLKKEPTNLYKYFIVLTSVLFFSIYLFGYWYQWYQIFLPLMSILAAYGVIDLFENINIHYKLPMNFLLFFLCGYLLINIYKVPVWNGGIVTMEKNHEQITELKRLLKITDIKDRCFFFNGKPSAIYIFRPHLFYTWNIPLYIEKKIKKVKDLNEICNDDFYIKLSQSNCTILNIMDDKFYFFSEKTRTYIYNNYNKIRNGLWLKNTIEYNYE